MHLHVIKYKHYTLLLVHFFKAKVESLFEFFSTKLANNKIFFMLLFAVFPLLLTTVIFHYERIVLKQEISSLKYEIGKLTHLTEEPVMAVDNCWIKVKASMGACSKTELESWKGTSNEVWDRLNLVSDWMGDTEKSVSQSLLKMLYPDSSTTEA